MNYKLVLQILLILTIIMSVAICIIKPQMHKSVMIYNSDYKIIPQNEVEIEIENMPTTEQNLSSKPVVVKTVDYSEYDTDFSTTPISITETKNSAKNITFSHTSTAPSTQKIAQNQTLFKFENVKPIQNTTTVQKQQYQPQTTSVKINTPQLETHQIQTDKIKSEPKITVVSPTQTGVKTNIPAPLPAKTITAKAPETVKIAPVQKPQTQIPTLSEQEEIVAWNIWRSNLQNKIMTDVKLPYVPAGTIFRFNFTVDKYGKISNLQTRSDNPQYTPYAIQYIAPVIRSYQGRSILNFPAGSKRVVTEANGAWKISASNKYSTPDDYNDVERIKR